jgi:hypothetical protein
MVKKGSYGFSSPCFDCFSMLESNISVLYSALAERVSLSFAKSLLESIGNEDGKHSLLLKEASEQLARMQARQNGKESLDNLYNITYLIYRELVAKEEAEEQLGTEQFFALTGKLILLEKVLRQKYSEAKSRTLKAIGEETFLDQHRNLNSFGSLFERLIDDCDQHQKILGTIQKLLEREAPEKAEFSALLTCMPSETLSVSSSVARFRRG